jgi:hypothetical protein
MCYSYKRMYKSSYVLYNFVQHCLLHTHLPMLHGSVQRTVEISIIINLLTMLMVATPYCVPNCILCHFDIAPSNGLH